jgi:hypothetical protein
VPVLATSAARSLLIPTAYSSNPAAVSLLCLIPSSPSLAAAGAAAMASPLLSSFSSLPHTDPRTPYNRKCAFDAGDYGLGFAANSLQLGCDCLGDVTYFDGVVNNSRGEAVVIRNAVCLHEEDHGLLWKHVDYR